MLTTLGVLVVGIAAAFWQLAGPRPVNPNTATAEELSKLPGVGSENAQRILSLRPFTDAADFERRMAGLSPAATAELRTRLHFAPGDCCVH